MTDTKDALQARVPKCEELTVKRHPSVTYAGKILVTGAALLRRSNGHLCDVANVRLYVDPTIAQEDLEGMVIIEALRLSRLHHGEQARHD